MALTRISGIARAARASAFQRTVRPATARNAFQAKSFAPIISQRFASDESNAKEGKVLSVIGAVVDGKTRTELWQAKQC